MKVNRTFKLSELLKSINADKKVKEECKNIKSVALSEVLSPETTNMEASDLVKEIYVIKIELAEKNVPMSFVEALNKEILFQVLFKICYNNQVKYICSIKQYNEDQTMKVLKMYSTDWITPLNIDLPITSKLEVVYKSIIQNISGYNFKIDETYSHYVERINTIKSIQQEIDKLTKQMNNEKQPNLKMKLNNKIKILKQEKMKNE